MHIFATVIENIELRTKLLTICEFHVDVDIGDKPYIWRQCMITYIKAPFMTFLKIHLQIEITLGK